MVGNYYSLNFDGPVRTDANHAGNKQYVPNSFKHAFRPDAAEVPYTVADNIVSRKSYYAHEGKKSGYAQATERYRFAMNNTAREHAHQNTAKLISHVKLSDYSGTKNPCTDHITPLSNSALSLRCKKRYLAQIHNIAPEYPKAVYDLMSKKGFAFSEVEEMSKSAHECYKEAKFRLGENECLVGYAPRGSVYNA
ncbi:hypothetical protein N7G274_002466 [Stereocaulon virgatum]|uniref:Uncharacterized protein n=1 Tax=Stereocaulon virgatum TaxID=373712 RepID=A0ABR4AFU8_9LECA